MTPNFELSSMERLSSKLGFDYWRSGLEICGRAAFLLAKALARLYLEENC